MTSVFSKDRSGVGDLITGEYCYDTSTSPSYLDDNRAVYSGAGGMRLLVNGLTFHSYSGHPYQFSVDLYNAPTDNSLQDAHALWSMSNVFDVEVPYAHNTMYWILGDETGRALSDTTLKSEAPDLSDWSSENIMVISSKATDAPTEFIVAAKVLRVTKTPDYTGLCPSIDYQAR